MVTSLETHIFLAVFVCLAPALLTVRFIWQRPRWWVIVVALALVGWAAWCLSVISHFGHLQALVEGTETPDPELLERAMSDGGPLVFAAFLGGLVSLVYALPWWGLFLLATAVRRAARRHR